MCVCVSRNVLWRLYVWAIRLVADDPSSAPQGREQHAVIPAEACTVCEHGAISMK